VGRFGPPLGQLFPGGGHPLSEEGVVDPSPDVDQVGVLVDQAPGEVDRQVQARVRVADDAAEGGADDFLDQLSLGVEDGGRGAEEVGRHVVPVVRGVERHERVVLVVDEVVGPAGLGVVDVGDGRVGVRIRVDELDDVAPVVALRRHPAGLVVVKADGKLAGLVGGYHLAEGVVTVTLKNEKASRKSVGSKVDAPGTLTWSFRRTTLPASS